MCGRYSLGVDGGTLAERFDATLEASVEPRYNCAPSQDLPVVTADRDDIEAGDVDDGEAGDGDRRVRALRWGLVPAWADDTSTSFINARGESVAEKPSFADAFERRRCLVPADGFYEWVDRDGDGDTQPYRVTLDGGDRPAGTAESVFAMAGIYERWTVPGTQTGLDQFGTGTEAETDAGVVESFAVVTTTPNEVVEPLHDRMSVVLAPDEEAAWLHGDPQEALSLVDPYPAAEMRAYPVSRRVNSPANDDPGLVEPLEG
jgi:putative SOS response-associated peptidase YedK